VVIDAIWGGDAELIGFAKVTRDITERRNAQQALEVTQARFVQSQKMEAVGQLTGGVAHDFNNLLAVVLGNLELARKRLPPDPRLRQLIENSIEAAKRGASLTQRMLAFARRQELKAAPVHIPDLVRNIADLLQRSIGPTVQIDTQFPLRLPPALADANQLELALLNLTVNARDAMPEGGSIHIAAREEQVVNDTHGLADGAYVCLSVTDTGEGMSKETLARAAEPFFTTKGPGKGTGLGLSMIHGFARQSGGRLKIRSVLGQGTTADIWLPIAQPEVGQSEEPQQEMARPSHPQRPLSVLVVDDDPLVLMNSTAMLEDLGHTVLEATSGEQALRVLRRETNIDLLITDQLMPGMKGTELAVTAKIERPDMPIIIATGYADLTPTSDLEFPRLSKPFSQDDLGRALNASMTPAGQVVPFRPKKG
jgi:nitrogen-specific signal transduction histidine kinase/ActR/RegA family two-component response regulator